MLTHQRCRTREVLNKLFLRL